MELLTILIAFAAFTVPGFAAYRVAGGSRHSWLMSMALSTAILMISQVPVRVYRIPIDIWGWSIIALTLVLLFLAYIRRCEYSSCVAQRSDGVNWLIAGSACVVAGWSIYWLVVGAYTEVPSDFWNHLGRIRWEVDYQSDTGRFIPYDLSVTGLLNRDYTHALHALAATLTGVSIVASVETTSFVATTVFLVASYWFGVAVFEAGGMARRRSAIASLAAVSLLVLWMGISVFSFVRYYATAPVMVCFVLYYGFVVAWVDVLKTTGSRVLPLVLCAVFAAAMLLAHVQEFGFALVMAGLVSVVYLLTGGNRQLARERRLLVWICVSGAVALIIAVIALLLLKEPGSVGSSKLLYLGHYVPWFEDVFILNPSYQFLQVMGWFGLSILVMGLLRFSTITHYPVLAAGLLVPFVTVLNPGFVYIYLHIAKYETLWRLLFLVPIPFVAAVLAMDVTSNGASKMARVAGVMVLLSITFLTFPYETSFGLKTYSRLGSLKDTSAQGADWLPDVLDFLEAQPKTSVFSDPVTSYVLRGGTKHTSRGWKFYPHTSGYDFAAMSERGELKQFLKTASGYLVLNSRRVENTRNGPDSGHWYADVLSTGKWYPPGMVRLLEESHAERVYMHDGVSVYRLTNRNEG